MALDYVEMHFVFIMANVGGGYAHCGDLLKGPSGFLLSKTPGVPLEPNIAIFAETKYRLDTML